MGINVLLLGSGGREHAMARSLSRSPLMDTLYIAPGNPGTAELGTNVTLSHSDFEAIAAFATEHEIGLTVIGPEQPLVEGLVDFLGERGHRAFGPDRYAAQLEGSKKFANEFMEQNLIPTADFVTFSEGEYDEAMAWIRERNRYPVVLKADGLAGGKGVFICESEGEAERRLEDLREDEKFQEAARTLVIEEFMEGEEVSVFVICDGQTARVIHNAQDHKRIGEGDTGLNTGGMGAYSPAPLMTPDLLARVEQEIVLPTISAMLLDGHPYRGILYCGLMITEDGPKVVEYNCRFGDPECQVILPSLESDLLELMIACVEGNLGEKQIRVDDRYRCCVVLASEGYPEAYEKGKKIGGLDRLSSDTLLFHAGTAMQGEELVTAGGRVLNVVAAGETLQEAIRNVYREVDNISFEGRYFRGDIGRKGLERLSG